MRNVDQDLLHVLDNRYRVIIVERIDDAQVVILRFTVVFIFHSVFDSIHLKVVTLEYALCSESVLEERHIFLFDGNIV